MNMIDKKMIQNFKKFGESDDWPHWSYDNFTAGKTILKRFVFLILTFVAISMLSSCASRPFRFADAPPVWEIDDQQQIPLPKTTRYIRMDYYYKVLVRRPAVTVFNYEPKYRARDVNSYDYAPASSWFTPRLGYRDISPEEILRGPQQIGPPRPPVRVVRAKHLGSNPGFIIADSRDRLYLIKFDPPDFPGIQTTTAFICNRLMWAFGYNVPEDYTFYFQSDEVPVDSTADISEEQVKLVFASVAPPVNGVYRATASLLLDGLYLGPIPDVGVRKDDPNDRINHQDRRVLRALKVFGAFINQTDIRIDNSLDVYMGPPGQGFVKHFFLDFGEAFGGHGAEHNRLWDGFAHIFSFSDLFRNLYTLGLQAQAWESLQYTPWKSVGAFEAEYFHPAQWKETYPFAPIQHALPDDNYWAAKVLAALNEQQLKALIDAADYPEDGAADYILKVLLKRRQKIIDYYFSRVSPLEWKAWQGDTLVVEDLGRQFLSHCPETQYLVEFRDDRGKRVAGPLLLQGQNGQINIPLSLPEKYLRVDVRVIRAGITAPRSAQFHIRTDHHNPRLVGIVH